jgi:hypothetical protein
MEKGVNIYLEAKIHNMEDSSVKEPKHHKQT